MASIARLPLEIRRGDPWPDVVSRSVAWADEQGVALRDAVVLLPFAQHLPLARREWARRGGWMPRIETTQTLSRSLGPGEPAGAGQISFDAAVDRLTARRLMLRTQGWAAAWSRRDPRGFDRAVADVVQSAHKLARAAAAVPPTERAAYWSSGRALLAAQGGPGATERALARVAFEWAAASAAPSSDALFDLRPSAWMALQCGGPDALTLGLLGAASIDVPCLLLDADVPLDQPFDRIAGETEVSVAVCADFEAEAQRTAAQVLAHLAAQRQPVAVIAQDRVLTRRVRALLARRGVPLLDETGWKLSTTRSGATVASLLRVALRGASTDDWLDWLKASEGAWPGLPASRFALQVLESALRRRAWVAPASVDSAELGDSAAALWQAASAVVQELAAQPLRSLAGWLAALREALNACGAWTQLGADDAGRQVLAALRLGGLAAGDLVADDAAMDLDDFTQWIDAALEEGSFRPAAPVDAPVIVTPLERAPLRPFGAVVLGGADEKRLGAGVPPHALFGDALAASLGLPSAAARRDAETLAFVQLLRAPHVSLLRRIDDGGEPLAASALLERLGLAFTRAGRGALPTAPDPGCHIELPLAPVARPLPAAGHLLPERLSASACEALRSCPYRFFALRLLRLREADELDDQLEKRDYGTWLHAVLHRFHSTRDTPLDAAAEAARLHAVAQQLQDELHFDPAAFLPFAASFARFVPRYVEWLHGRDAIGAQWLDGEVELTARPAAWAGTEMHGVIDRVDSVPGDSGPVTRLIDYKTGSAQALRNTLKQPLEDTQLAFYAALMANQSEAGGDVSAAYLPLDESGEIRELEHKDVEQTGRVLVREVGQELARVRAGEAMPALGEGRVCDFCEARGLCRRDHWGSA